MSLFEDDRYEYRETCFVIFPSENRPGVEVLLAALEGLGDRYRVSAPERTPDGEFDSVSIRCPFDRSAMDISYVSGDDVRDQVGEWREEFRQFTLSDTDLAKLETMERYESRFDIFHFEQRPTDSEEDAMDPGALLIVLERLAELTGGIGVDPQSATLI